MSIIAADMPSSLCDGLQDALTSALASTPGAVLQDMDSSNVGDVPPKFPVLHFSCYNRNSTRVSLIFFLYC